VYYYTNLVSTRIPGQKDKSRSFYCRVNVPGNFKNKKLSIIPDKVFALYFPKDKPHRNKVYCFLEADRTTMPIMRTDPLTSSYIKKLAAYRLALKKGLFKQLFKANTVRVLTITRSEERIKNMIQANKLIDRTGRGSNLFLFSLADQFTLGNPTKILDPVWQNGRGGKQSDIIN
jgi:hypothetical protein